MSYSNVWELTGVYRKFTGTVSGDEILRSNIELYNHPNYTSIKYTINDFSCMKDHSIDISHTQIYASVDDLISESKGSHKIAIVVVQEEHIILAEHYKNSLENKFFECKIFNTIEKARDWVDT